MNEKKQIDETTSNQAWAEKNVPTIIGLSVFGLIILAAVLMNLLG